MGSNGGRGSYGGEREWSRGLERGSSPGLIVSRVHALWPVSARCCLCPHVVACVCVLFPMSAHHCLCPCVITHVRTCCPWSTCRSLCPFMFVGGHFRSWAWVVAFVQGQSSSFGGICLLSWATAGCGGGEPLVGGGESSGLV